MIISLEDLSKANIVPTNLSPGFNLIPILKSEILSNSDNKTFFANPIFVTNTIQRLSSFFDNSVFGVIFITEIISSVAEKYLASSIPVSSYFISGIAEIDTLDIFPEESNTNKSSQFLTSKTVIFSFPFPTIPIEDSFFKESFFTIPSTEIPRINFSFEIFTSCSLLSLMTFDFLGRPYFLMPSFNWSIINSSILSSSNRYSLILSSSSSSSFSSFTYFL